MALFKNTTYSVAELVSRIEKGEIALPDLQRPFVWKASKVRDLFDSLYRGFPVGSLYVWATRAEPSVRQIGMGQRQAGPHLLVVDGQQRMTSLYAALTGSPVVSSDFEEVRIRIAFPGALLVRRLRGRVWALRRGPLPYREQRARLCNTAKGLASRLGAKITNEGAFMVQKRGRFGANVGN
ncbi:DUF262 domain-containing protein [Saccharopolyspora shandongensis]|uniref:DUF262 domain-containing protein n=1 Tax=Saccharopolyspora shandongensis TaxID=418495 RepID=UPI0033C959CC